MKYRKKPVVIEAWQNTGTPMAHQEDTRPKWLMDAIFADKVRFKADGFGFTNTDGHGWVPFSPGDWIIKGLEGELYPCVDSVFQASYDPMPAFPDQKTRTCAACMGRGKTGLNPFPDTPCSPCGGTGRVAV